MTTFWKSLLLYCIKFSIFTVCFGSSQESLEAGISYHKEFNSNVVLVQFLENEKLVLDVDRIKYFFILPNNFYCENVKMGEKILPLFFINSTKENFLSFLIYVFNADVKDIEKLLQGNTGLLASKMIILNLKKCLHESFQSSVGIKDFIIGKKRIVYLPEITADCFKNWKFQMRYIIPAITMKNVHFFPKQGKNSPGRSKSGSNWYVKYTDKDFCVKVESFKSYWNWFCYKVAVQFSPRLFDERFVFKKVLRISESDRFRYLNEITVFSHVSIKDHDGFYRPQSAVINENDGCIGFLMKNAEFGDLKTFVASNPIKDYEYFYSQLLNVAKYVKILHKNGIQHCDLRMSHIYVCKKEGIKESSDYYFLIGDFEESSILHLEHSGNTIQKKQSGMSIECPKCSSLLQHDLFQFVQILPEILLSFYLKNISVPVNNKSLLILTVTLKNTSSFNTIETYLNSLKSMQSTKTVNNSNSESFRFTNIPTDFVVISHLPDRCDKYSNGDVLTFDNTLQYTLYSISDLSIKKISDKNIIVAYVNLYYYTLCSLKGILVKDKSNSSTN